MLITIYRGLFRTSAFSGMTELYREILEDPKSIFYIVSSSPPAIEKKIEFFLKKNKFPKAKLILRDWLRQPSIPKYKQHALLQLVEKSKYPVILIGDDTEHDPFVFAAVAKKFPLKVMARYVRVIKGQELPEGTYGFYTAFDIACAELETGRLSNDQVLKIGQAVLKAKKNSRIIPNFSLKPPKSFIPILKGADNAVIDIWNKIQKRIIAMPKRKENK